MLKNLNPRRVWLLRTQGDVIEAQASRYIPHSYSGPELLAKARSLASAAPVAVQLNEPQMGDSNQGAGAAHRAGPSKGATQSTAEIGLAGAEAALLYGHGLYEKFQQVDDHVYEAMSRLASHNIANLANLHASLGEYKHDILGEISKGVLSKWKGHLAEVYAAEHFSHAGHVVDWPATSNQEGYDFFLDGHAVNIKLVADASSLHEHFARFPDIPVVVPHDANLGALSQGAFHFAAGDGLDQQLDTFLSSAVPHKIIVDDALSAAAIKEQAMDSADVAVGGAGAAEAHFPWITLATASWREGRLLYENKTDLKSASKNLAADVTGRGGGALLGAKAGATLGTVFAPGLGTAVGGLLGGIVGGVSGGMASNAFKRRDLVAALELTSEAQAELKGLQARLERTSTQKVEQRKHQLQSDMDALEAGHQNAIDAEVRALRKWRQDLLRVSHKELTGLVEVARREINELRLSLDEQLAQVGFWQRWIWPDAHLVALEVASERLNAALRCLNSALDRWGADGGTEIDVVLESLGKQGLGREAVKHMLAQRELERLYREHVLRDKISQAYEVLAVARQRSFETIANLIRELSDEIRKQLAPVLEDLQGKIDKVNIEKRKLGLAE